MTTTERLIQLAEAWVEAEVRVSHGCHSQQRKDAKAAFRSALSSTLEAPALDMLLFCPKCGEQHIDKPQPEKGWTNPPHRSHECQFCGLVWRPADVPTNGVETIATHGKADCPPHPRHYAVEAPADVREVARKIVGSCSTWGGLPNNAELIDAIASALTAQRAAGVEAAAKHSIKLTPHEIQSNYDRVKFAEGLIRQLPENHDGRNTWLLNYGRSIRPDDGEGTK